MATLPLRADVVIPSSFLLVGSIQNPQPYYSTTVLYYLVTTPPINNNDNPMYIDTNS